ncbi:DegT/DnrJ/EryC1/StrS family aminotransferase [Algoriphagus confluentis]|uniref:DegT/DnrJ/EryC1/StrS family aminotransferase n=1 Tax=Algoriphagus confluentis TaxID=1697556 RepID=A0ABQ6PQP8_9BACT|nr:DegT/DnrJ/EryC1/StrS family aminotransferase [Algoriphagus confluentis]
MKSIQMVDLRSQYERIKPEIDLAIQGVIENSAFINGPEVKAFAKELAEYTGAEFVIPCGNGTDALQIAMMALDFKPGQEVIVPAFTYVAAVEMISLLGLKPKFVDVTPDTFEMNPSELEKAIGPNVVGIIPVHLYGQCSNMEFILDVANRNNLKVIEDTAQAIGAVYSFSNGKKAQAGTMGHVGTTSFFPSKNLGCYGDGGAMFTNDPDLAERLNRIANHGQKKKYHHESIGVNSRLDTLQAAILRVKLKELDRYCAARNQVADRYDQAFKNHTSIKIPKRASNSTHVFHQYTVQIEGADRDALKSYLQEKGIPTMIYYPIPVPKQQAYLRYGYQTGDFPVSESLCEKVLSFPIHTEMDPAQQDFIIDSILSYF